MSEFKYNAIDASGTKVSGVVVALTPVRARNELLSQSLEQIEMKPKKGFRGIEITKKQIKVRNDVDITAIVPALQALFHTPRQPSIVTVACPIIDR